MVTQSIDQDLPSTCKLASEDAMWAMRLVEWPPRILDGSAQMTGGMLVFETLDAVPVGSRE